MAQDRTYNGWTNWDTWNANLWLANTEGPYRRLTGWGGSVEEFAIAARQELDALGNPDGIDCDKVNWQEIYEAFTEE